MSYKVFFVEDEIVTREGIRDNVNWTANGFEFCGEASDGEMALPLLQAARPDVLITDIKMPFMDGLQLCKIVRERMPWIKIIILSGHDEFEFAQKAIELGVREYLLKPITVQNIHHSLQKIAAQLDHRDAAIDRRHLAQHVERAVAGSIVDQDDFEALAIGLHYRLQAVVEVGDVLLLVMQGYNDGIPGH